MSARFYELKCVSVTGFYSLAELLEKNFTLAISALDLNDIFLYGPVPESMRGDGVDDAVAAEWTVLRLRPEPNVYYYALVPYEDLKAVIEGRAQPLKPIVAPPVMGTNQEDTETRII
jgi:hypothetical protein